MRIPVLPSSACDTRRARASRNQFSVKKVSATAAGQAGLATSSRQLQLFTRLPSFFTAMPSSWRASKRRRGESRVDLRFTGLSKVDSRGAVAKLERDKRLDIDRHFLRPRPSVAKDIFAGGSTIDTGQSLRVETFPHFYGLLSIRVQRSSRTSEAFNGSQIKKSLAFL